MCQAGTQIDSQTLYERQQKLNKNNSRKIAPVVVAIDIRTPDNIASILRIAEAAYSNKVIFVSSSDKKIELDNKIKRLSRDTHKALDIEQYTISEFLILSSQLPEMIAIEITSQSENIFDVSLPDKCCLLIGSESHGINNQLLEKCKRAVHIPMYGNNGSMNVTHALAISLYEWRRQKQ